MQMLTAVLFFPVDLPFYCARTESHCLVRSTTAPIRHAPPCASNHCDFSSVKILVKYQVTAVGANSNRRAIFLFHAPQWPAARGSPWKTCASCTSGHAHDYLTPP
jgi:hypothetical protein